MLPTLKHARRSLERDSCSAVTQAKIRNFTCRPRQFPGPRLPEVSPVAQRPPAERWPYQAHVV